MPTDVQYRATADISCNINDHVEETVLRFCVWAPCLGLAYVKAGSIASKVVEVLSGELTDLRCSVV